MVALAGNPNSGKTTLFNALTRSSQHVGNWPGKTVERRSGTFTAKGRTVEIVDLPGTYSLAALALDEAIARDFLLEGGCDVVLVVVDASNAERTLYLATQILEMGVPTVVVLNMSDVADRRGLVIDTAELSRRLGAPVIRTVARRREGLDELVAWILESAQRERV